jgi:arylsulfatase A-like enzyme
MLPPAARAAEAGVPPPPRADHVIVISLDGLRPDAIERAPAKNLLALIREGAYCPRAETIRPSITLPSHTSMITGLDYARHGVTWNTYRPGLLKHPTFLSVAREAGKRTGFLFGKDKFRYLVREDSVDWFLGEPVRFLPLGRAGTVPTVGFYVLAAIFGAAALWLWGLLTAAAPALTPASSAGAPGRSRWAFALLFAAPILIATAAYALHDLRLLQTWLITVEADDSPRDATTAPGRARPRVKPAEADPGSLYDAMTAGGLAAAFAREWPRRDLALTFIHMRDPDEAGHLKGWMSPAYLRTVERCDRAVGTIVDAVRRSGRWERTAVLVTADHGGSLKRHYDARQPDKPENVTIPWICVGPGVPAGLTIDRVVRIYDTAPTALAFLGIPPPPGIDGRVVEDVLKPR